MNGILGIELSPCTPIHNTNEASVSWMLLESRSKCRSWAELPEYREKYMFYFHVADAWWTSFRFNSWTAKFTFSSDPVVRQRLKWYDHCKLTTVLLTVPSLPSHSVGPSHLGMYFSPQHCSSQPVKSPARKTGCLPQVGASFHIKSRPWPPLLVQVQNSWEMLVASSIGVAFLIMDSLMLKSQWVCHSQGWKVPLELVGHASVCSVSLGP